MVYKLTVYQTLIL